MPSHSINQVQKEPLQSEMIDSIVPVIQSTVDIVQSDVMHPETMSILLNLVSMLMSFWLDTVLPEVNTSGTSSSTQ